MCLSARIFQQNAQICTFCLFFVFLSGFWRQILLLTTSFPFNRKPLGFEKVRFTFVQSENGEWRRRTKAHSHRRHVRILFLFFATKTRCHFPINRDATHQQVNKAQQQADDVSNAMKKNITKMYDRGDKLNDLSAKTSKFFFLCKKGLYLFCVMFASRSHRHLTQFPLNRQKSQTKSFLEQFKMDDSAFVFVHFNWGVCDA